MEHRIALWDVIEACRRPGSLDSAISKDGMRTNDFAGFFEDHPRITHIYFNGQKAADLFRKRVIPGLTRRFEYHTLPSTSPAYAARSYTAKLEAWSVIKR
jgi:hypoxanthine-DNA glycosylase